MLRELPRFLKGGYLWAGILYQPGALCRLRRAALLACIDRELDQNLRAVVYIAWQPIFFGSMEAISSRLIALTLLAVLGVALIAIFS
ncbi:MAG: hypothetical protein AB1767_13830 [Bacillota bacterium]